MYQNTQRHITEDRNTGVYIYRHDDLTLRYIYLTWILANINELPARLGTVNPHQPRNNTDVSDANQIYDRQQSR
jgi:hypothetical protein